MRRKALGWTAAALALAAAGFFGYRALGGWLVAAMAGTIKAPLSGPEAAPAAAPFAAQARQAQAPAAIRSGLDLIITSAADPAPGAAPMSAEQLKAVKQAGLGLIDSLRPMLLNPAFTRRLTQAQAGQYSQLMALLGQAEAAARGQGPLDLKEMAAQVRKAQQLSLSLMSQLPRPPARAEQGQAPQ